MNFISKIEDIINSFLNKLIASFLKLIPSGIRNLFATIPKIPHKTKDGIFKFISYLKIKAKESHQELMSMNAEKRSNAFRSVKAFLLTPLYMMGHWLDGLSTGQSILLLTFTSASLLSMISIGFSGKKIIYHDEEEMISEQMRLPASEAKEEEITFDRPEYYKKQERHFGISNLKLPLYEGGIESIRTVDIDFNATLSNRNSRLFLEKNEFPLRDHLVLTIEPSLSDFPLEEEGKEIIRGKITREINAFLAKNDIEGEVVELKLTYILAN